MKTILDIATEDAEDLAAKSVAVRSKAVEHIQAKEHFLRKRYRNLYRAHILRTRGRTPSTRECDLALDEAMENANAD